MTLVKYDLSPRQIEKLAQQGWELISTEGSTSTLLGFGGTIGTTYYFKRRSQP